MKTKHRILSVLTVLALLASLTAVMVAPVYATTGLAAQHFTTRPQLGHVGQVVTITVGGYAPLREQIIRVYYAGVVVPTTPVAPEVATTGVNTVLHFAVPASTRGDHSIEVRVGIVKMTPVDTTVPGRDNYFTVRPRVTLGAPRTGPRDATRTATVTGFAAGRSIDVFAGSPDAGVEGEIWTGGTVIGSGITDASGGAVVPVTMRAKGRITARDGAGHESMFNPHKFEFTPGITVSPTSGLAGSTVRITGTDHTPNVLAGALTRLQFAGVDVPLADQTWASRTNLTATPHGSTAAGAIDLTFTIDPAATPGAKTILFNNAGPAFPTISNATAVFTVAPRALTLTPASGPAGTPVTITGTGFPAGRRGEVTAPNVIERVEFMTTADGAIPAGITATILPGAPDGRKTLTVRVAIGVGAPTVDCVAATATFTVHASAITVSPTSGAPGTPVTVRGVGFRHHGTLADLRIGEAEVTPIPTVIADPVGNFTATFVVPGLAAGATTVTATVAGVARTALFTITPAPVIVTVEVGLAAAWPALGESVWEFRDGVWLQYFIARPEMVPAAVRLTRLERGRAYWVFLTRAITDVHIGGETRTLSAGWHNIGWR